MRDGDVVAEIISANWHVTSRCNYSCKFCFAAHRSREVDSEAEIDRILAHANYIGIKKMSFVGGEPLIHEKLPHMLKTTKHLGMTSSIVTNGASLDENMLSKIGDDLDWIGISIDSADESVEKCLGRGFGNHVANTIKVADMVKSAGIKLKINTTVTKMSYDEDMTELIRSINPDRWKVFQYLHIRGHNDRFSDEMNITAEEFQMFISKNKSAI